MALQAISRVTGKEYALWRMNENQQRDLDFRISTGDEVITCVDRDCQGVLHIRCLDSVEKIVHFAHNPGTGSADCVARMGGESETHRAAKLALARDLESRFSGVQIETERKIIVENGYKDSRRVDISAAMPDGSLVACEIQLSGQTVRTTEHRTCDLLSAGYDRVVWIWGEPASTFGTFHNQRRWCAENCDLYVIMTVPRVKLFGKDIANLHGIKFQYIDCVKERSQQKQTVERVAQAREEAKANLFPVPVANPIELFIKRTIVAHNHIICDVQPRLIKTRDGYLSTGFSDSVPTVTLGKLRAKYPHDIGLYSLRVTLEQMGYKLQNGWREDLTGVYARWIDEN